MVHIKTVNASNSLIKDLPSGLVAAFIGATSGIGEEALRQFTQYATSPKIYIVGRSASSAAPLISQLKQSNPEATIEFVEKNVSLLRDIDAFTSYIKSKEQKLDILMMSAGFISFVGRDKTSEGLDASMSTRYYGRMRAIENLLPLLRAAPSARVVSILAAGQEGKLIEDDLDLRKAGNYSIGNAATATGTMGTLTLGHFATENPGISFVHAFPGFVATNNLTTKGSSGLVGLLLRLILPPIRWLFAISPKEAGARVLSYATSARYAVAGGESTSVPLATGLERAKQMDNRVFLVGGDGESVGKQALLNDCKSRGVDDAVWAWTQKVFSTLTAAAP
ncbi:short-chain dehydrogenase/reductase [Microthyrium microscopicum]|uniref:Short-chain dehydrogenase/reductase n=1 Tax=Microthyrium microscopicum TaxID=703497 RepID=A0A6A6UHW1_9PEZI|nr:short-chain dehydrogenase/reductase [Microthyrium microscopicum]